MRRLSCLLAILLLTASVPGILHADENTIGPSLEITSPPSDSTINGNEVQVAIEFASAEKMPVTRVQVFLDGKYVTERIYDQAQPEGMSSFKWDTTRTTNGRHKLDAQIFSGDEYLGMTSCVVYVSNKAKDIAPPRVALLSPKEGAVVSGIIPIVIEASDNSGVEPMVNVFVDDSLRSVKNRGPYEYQWDTTGYTNGPHTIAIGAEDDARNMSPTKSVNVVVRNQTNPQPIMMETSSAPTAPESVASSSSYAATPAPSTKSSGENKEVARVAGSKTESFEVTRNTAELAPRPVAAPKPVAVVPAQTTVPQPTLVAKAEANPVQVAQATECCPGGKCDVDESLKPMSKTPNERMTCDGTCEVYTVREGDNLYTLAKTKGVSSEAIAALNELADPSKLSIGQKLYIPPAPKMVPVRPVFEAAGGTLVWENGRKAVRAVCSQNDVTFRIGSMRVTLNSSAVKMDKAAVVSDGRTMVPESFITGPLGMTLPGE